MLTHCRLFLVALAIGLTACHTLKKPEPEPKPGQSVPLWSWDEKAEKKAKGEVQVKVVLAEQKAHILKGRKEIGWSYVATGISKYPTPTGTYRVMERTSDKHSNLYGRIYDAQGECVNEDAKMGRDPIPEGGKFEGAKMAYWMRLTNDGLGMHVGPIPRPGSRASHGCVRLPRDAAPKIFHAVRAGTEVTIVQEANDPQPPKRTLAPTPAVAASKPKVEAAPRARPTELMPPLFEDKPPSLAVPPLPKPPGS